jgi:hypothetical protein
LAEVSVTKNGGVTLPKALVMEDTNRSDRSDTPIRSIAMTLVGIELTLVASLSSSSKFPVSEDDKKEMAGYEPAPICKSMDVNFTYHFI